MIKKLALFISISILLFSCKSKHFFEDYVEIPNNVWNINQVVKFSVPIDNPKSLYNISINVRHGYTFQTKNLWMFIKTTSPSGKMQLDTLNCILTDDKNAWKGDCLGDMCDYLVPFADSVTFNEAGTYTFEIVQGMRQDNVPSVVEIGLIIDKKNINEK